MSAADNAFDAGVTALGRDDHPSAIANLLAARVAAPRDAEIAAALTAARTASGGTVHVEAPLPVAGADLALGWVAVNLALSVAIALHARRAALTAILAVWLLCFGAWVVRLATMPEYVVVSGADTTAHAANDTESLERYRLHRGDELLLLETRDGWLKVEGPDGAAYVQADTVVRTGR